MLLIINADDFGRDEETNKAIVASFHHNLCSSTTIMPNMPGFEEACQLAHDNKLLDNVGMHLVFADGCPLTEPIKSSPKFCNEEGELCFSQSKLTYYLERSDKEVCAQEIRAQIARCRNNGLPLTHADSHYHIHNQWGIASVLIPILHEERVPYLRLTRNCGTNLGLSRRFYKTVFNNKLKREGLARTQYFGTLADYSFLVSKKGSIEAIHSFETLVHPKYHKEILIDGASQKSLTGILGILDSYYEAVSFRGIKYIGKNSIGFSSP